MASLWLNNLISYTLQIAVFAIVGTLLMTALAIRIPKIRLLCWQALLVACLLLPALQPWRLQTRAGGNVQVSSRIRTIGNPLKPSTAFPVSWQVLVLALAGAGVAVRLSILAVGFLRLRRYRRESRFASGAFASLQRRMNVFADVMISNDVSGPVTFGFLQPVILIPEACLDDESIACHELVHVRRRDWLWTVFEESVVSVFWFHPAMWWLVSEIQLTREEAVDREVVTVLNSREQYLEALLSLAAARAGFDLAPASLFLRKRHLQRRVTSLLKEISMSRFRLTSSLALFVAAAGLAGWFGVRSFPLQAAPQEHPDSSGVTVQAGALKILHRTQVTYPQEALAKGIQGSVLLELSLSDNGTVSDAKVLSGPEELRKAALQSVLQWHFAKTSQLPVKTEVSVDFQLPSENNAAAKRHPAPPPENRSMVAKIIIEAPDAVKQQLMSRLTLRAGDKLTQSSVDDLFAVANDVDEHLQVGLQPTPDDSATNVIVMLGNAASPAGPPSKIRIGGNVQAANLMHKVTPIYPLDAKQARIQGTVRYTATISKDGHVEGLDLVSGDPALEPSAREAVMQWVYKPTLLNGNPVEVVTQIDINFTLSQ